MNSILWQFSIAMVVSAANFELSQPANLANHPVLKELLEQQVILAAQIQQAIATGA